MKLNYLLLILVVLPPITFAKKYDLDSHISSLENSVKYAQKQLSKHKEKEKTDELSEVLHKQFLDYKTKRKSAYAEFWKAYKPLILGASEDVYPTAEKISRIISQLDDEFAPLNAVSEILATELSFNTDPEGQTSELPFEYFLGIYPKKPTFNANNMVLKERYGGCFIRNSGYVASLKNHKGDVKVVSLNMTTKRRKLPICIIMLLPSGYSAVEAESDLSDKDYLVMFEKYFFLKGLYPDDKGRLMGDRDSELSPLREKLNNSLPSLDSYMRTLKLSGKDRNAFSKYYGYIFDPTPLMLENKIKILKKVITESKTDRESYRTPSYADF